MIKSLRSYIGIPYSMNEDTDNGISCYNLVKRIYREKLDKELPDYFDLTQFKIVEIEDLEIGDIIAFSENMRFWQHVGMYVGNGMFIHSSPESQHVLIEFIKDYKPKNNRTIRLVGGFRWKKLDQ